MTATTIPFDVLNRWTGEVQFTAQIECAADALPSLKLGLAVRWAHKNGASLDGASLDGASLVGASLDGASLDGASLDANTLRSFKADLWLTLSEIGGPLEAQHLIAKLKAGQMDGSTYGSPGTECACLVGTIAQSKGVSATALDHGSSRPAEQWFMMITPGDKPGDESGGGFASAKALEWAEQWCAAHGHPTTAPKARKAKAVA